MLNHENCIATKNCGFYLRVNKVLLQSSQIINGEN